MLKTFLDLSDARIPAVRTLRMSSSHLIRVTRTPVEVAHFFVALSDRAENEKSGFCWTHGLPTKPALLTREELLGRS